jgi:hypothetical protein
VSGNRWEENNETQGIVALAIAAGAIVASLGVIATPRRLRPTVNRSKAGMSSRPMLCGTSFIASHTASDA